MQNLRGNQDTDRPQTGKSGSKFAKTETATTKATRRVKDMTYFHEGKVLKDSPTPTVLPPHGGCLSPCLLLLEEAALLVPLSLSWFSCFPDSVSLCFLNPTWRYSLMFCPWSSSVSFTFFERTLESSYLLPTPLASSKPTFPPVF